MADNNAVPFPQAAAAFGVRDGRNDTPDCPESKERKIWGFPAMRDGGRRMRQQSGRWGRPADRLQAAEGMLIQETEAGAKRPVASALPGSSVLCRQENRQPA